MTDPSESSKEFETHIDGIKGHLTELQKLLPKESLKGLQLQLTESHEMLVCYPDPDHPGQLICR